MTHTILKGKGKRKRKGKGQGRDKEGKGREMDKLSGDSRRKTHIIPPAWAKPFRAWPPVYLMIFTAVAPACEFDQPGAVAFTPWQDRHWGRPARAAGATAYTHISVYVQYMYTYTCSKASKNSLTPRMQERKTMTHNTYTITHSEM